MNTLVVSDVHLNHRFDEKKYLYLEKLFSSVDRIILNGDFWDGYRTTFEKFLSSPWKKLFPLLKSKNTIYIYGNHDKKVFCDQRISLFSNTQNINYDLTIGNDIYHIEHGHNLYKTIDMLYPISKKILFILNNLMQRIEQFLVFLGSPHTFLLKEENSEIKRKLTQKKFTHWYICGHTHYAEVDEKARFANSGFIQFGHSSYLIIDSLGLSLKTYRY